MDVLAGEEGLLHGVVVRHVGEHSELDLAVVGVYKHPALARHEHLADLGAQVCAHRDVLQVGICGRQAACGGHGVLEGGAHPPVRADDLQKAVCIGGLQLGQGAVVHDLGDDGVLAAQLFEHLHVGGPAGFGLFPGGQAQLFKQDDAKLPGRVDVEFLPGQAVDLRLDRGDLLLERLVKAVQGRCVHQNASLLHPGQHRAKGQIHLFIEGLQTLLRQRFVKRRIQRQHSRGSAGCKLVWRKLRGLLAVGQGDLAVFHGKARKLVLAPGGVKQIGGHLGVEDDALPGKIGLHQIADQLLRAVRDQAQAAVKQGSECGPARLALGGEHKRLAVGAQRKGRKPRACPQADGAALPGFAGVLQGCKVRRGADHACRGGPGAVRRRLGRQILALRAAQVIFVDELDKLQPGKEIVQSGPVRLAAQSVLHAERHRRVKPDGGKLKAQIRTLAAVLQLFKELALHILGREIFIDPVQGPVFGQKVRCGLRPHPGHAGDVVRAVAHQGLEIDQADGGKAILLRKGRRIIERGVGLPALGDHELDPHVLVDELQAVAVAGDDDAVPARLAGFFGDGADDVVGLPALAGVDGDIHGRKHLLHHGHLLGQLLRHAVAGGLVAVVAQVAEGGAVQIEGHTQAVGLLLGQHPVEDVQKAEDGVGVLPVPGGEQPHPVKGAVDDAVAVKDHELHGASLLLGSAGVRSASTWRPGGCR